jgi:GNAT superfamily N-acetyltransferase
VSAEEGRTVATDYPLTRANRIVLARAFRDVPRVDLSIDCALEDQMGSAFADDLENPRAFQIAVGPFRYFAGDPAVLGAQEMLKALPPGSFLMPSAPGWLEAAQAIYGEKLVPLRRHSFSSKGLSSAHLRKLVERSRFADRVRQMDASFAARVWGQDHVVDLSTYESPEDFGRRGIGFYVEEGGKILGATFASLVSARGIEVSLYVLPDYRRQGIGTLVASRLLLSCLESGRDPHWDAANPESCRLAERLGYAPAGTYVAHYLQG